LRTLGREPINSDWSAEVRFGLEILQFTNCLLPGHGWALDSYAGLLTGAADLVHDEIFGRRREFFEPDVSGFNFAKPARPTPTPRASCHGMKLALTPSAVRLRASAASLSSLLPELRYHPRAIIGPEHVGPAPVSWPKPCFRRGKREHRDVGIALRVRSCRTSQR
jgi:hypothetical protein